MNNATFAGRIGRDAETRYLKDGTAVTGFSLAIDQHRNGEKSTLWIKCSIWKERGEKLAQYLTKGTSIVVSGPVRVVPWLKDGEAAADLTVDVRELTLLGGGKDREEPRQERKAPQQKQEQDDFDDECPF